MNNLPPSSAYTWIYWLIQDRKIEAEDLFQIKELYWPTFITRDGYVFIKENFSEEEYKRLVNQGSHIEFWINFLTIDDFFAEVSNGEEKSIALATLLVEIWQVKLKAEFPLKIFTVKCLQDEDSGDYGLTFYQEGQLPQNE